MRIGFFAIGMAAALAACGGDDSGVETTTNTANASAAVSQTGTFRGAVGSSDGGGAAGAVYSLGASASAIISPSGQQSRSVPVRAVTGDCTCDASGCTFVDCGDSGWTLNGTVGISGDTYTFDLEMAVELGQQSWGWAYAGELTATATSLDGNLDGEGGGTFTNPQDGSTIETDWSWGVDYNAIVLDGAGCATGGSVDASVSYSGATAQGSFSYSGSGTVEFGPTCGEATAK